MEGVSALQGLFFSALPPSSLSITNKFLSRLWEDSNGKPCRPAEQRRLNALVAEVFSETPQATDRETKFRHSCWLPARRAVRAALVAAEVPTSRLVRFDACGARCVVEINRETGECRCKAWYCGDRFCNPCGAARGVRARRAVATLLNGRASWFVTLTQCARTVSCKEAMDKLQERIRDLRKDPEFLESFDGGVDIIETKIGSGSLEWHVHQHGIWTGKGMSKERLADVWYRITGDSWRVDVEEVRDPQRAGGYVCKYITKGFDSSLLDDPVHLAECVRALSGRRLLRTWGSWYNALPDVDAPQVGQWEFISSLDALLVRADAGDECARGLIWSLRCRRGQGALEEAHHSQYVDETAIGESTLDPPEGY